MEKVVNNKKTDLKEYRYERKFIFKNTTLEDLLETIIYTNPYCFNEIFNQRSVNNIYFDDNNYSCYHQNVSGIGYREKYRLRWYSDFFHKIANPIFEIKRKYAELGDKYLHKVSNLEIDINTLDTESIYLKIKEQLKKSGNKKIISRYDNLFPSLYNSYQRRYFLSHCEKFRITLDYNMSFTNPQLTTESYQITDEIILELKYNQIHDNEARKITEKINNRLSKNSKYIRGIDFINFKHS